MYKKLSVLVVFILIFLVVGFNAGADVRTDNIELFLVIDKSKSMVEEISDVTSYINDVFIKDFLIEGDRLVLIQFYGKADLIFDDIITENNKNTVISDIASIPADGRFTDIGNALDKLDRTVKGAGRQFERKYLILLTDGRQEAPPESPYYTPDGSFNHAFLENTKIIQRSGWKIIILGIGQDTAVRELAEELATTSEVLDFSETRPLAKSPAELLGRVLSENFTVEGNAALFNLVSEGYSEDRTVIIEQITFQQTSGNYELLDEPVSLTVKPGVENAFKISFSEEKMNAVQNRTETGSLIFNFSGNTPFLPAVFDSVIIAGPDIGADEKKESKNAENDKNKGFNWLIIVIVILVIAVIIAFIIIRNTILHRDDDETKKQSINKISGDS